LLDSETRELFRKDKPVHLQPKVFRVLELLLENRPRVMSKQELHEKVWSETFISEATLASAISDIRGTIGDTGKRARFIRTVHGYGYGFTGEANPEEALTSVPARVAQGWLVWDDKEIILTEGAHVLGRGPEAFIRVEAKGVSRRHAQIRIQEGRANLKDLGSKNGTYLNDCLLRQPHPLNDGDQIRLGSIVFVFRIPTAGESTSTFLRSEAGRRESVTRRNSHR
jgi:DNA-binding winged helix-turn-helix (wHTH) protein